MALFVLGFGDPLGTLIDMSGDVTGLLLDEQRLPKRISSLASTTRRIASKLNLLLRARSGELRLWMLR